MRKEHLFTSESVSEGHPDKVADFISDSILDAFLAVDSEARVALETLVTSNTVVLAGEIKTNKTWPDIGQIAIDAVKELGYEQPNFNWKTLNVMNYVHHQSADIAVGVDAADNKEEGAGDQGLMFGYACREAENYMPAAIYYSHKILRILAEKRKAGLLAGLLQDAKSQVTLRYEDGIPVKVEKVVVSHQHEEYLTTEDVKNMIIPVLNEVFGNKLYTYSDDNTFINPTGKFVIGGPDGDTGLTGRKIIVDTYGGSSPHGGGAFSGKDPTKVDRSAAYMARYIAKNFVAAGIADQCTIQLSYVIGKAFPLSVYVDFHGTSKVSEDKAEKFINDNLDLSPKGIRTHLKLNFVKYKPTSSYGHFGRNPESNAFTWEALDLVDAMQKYFK
ncbi:methionine adenosyltransferase [Rickettsiales bacterium LUAb2]